ncbi:MAG: lyase family protein [Bryobacteraceae bacterium]
MAAPEMRNLPLRNLHAALEAKACEFDDVIKIGRTHLQNAVSVRLGQEFSGYAWQVEAARDRVEEALPLARGLTPPKVSPLR